MLRKMNMIFFLIIFIYSTLFVVGFTFWVNASRSSTKYL